MKKIKTLNLLTFILGILALTPNQMAVAECPSRALTITNSSKQYIQIYVNDVPYLILLPGDTRTTDLLINNGENKVVAKPLTKKGENNPNLLGPKPTKFSIDCAVPGQNTINFENKHFVKHTSSGGHGSAPPKKPKPVGNKGGQKLNLSGVWLSANKKNPQEYDNCSLTIVDVGDALLTVDYKCPRHAVPIPMIGLSVGGKAVFYGNVSGPGGTVTFSFDLQVFDNFETDEDTGKPIDVMKGKFQASNLAPLVATAIFVRLPDSED